MGNLKILAGTLTFVFVQSQATIKPLKSFDNSLFGDCDQE